MMPSRAAPQSTRETERYIVASSRLLRLGGIACTVGGLLFAIWGYVHKDDYTPLYLNAVAHVLALIVPVLFMLGLATIHGRYAARAGALARSGILLGVVGSALGAVRAIVDLAVPSLYPLDVPSAWIMLLLLRVWTPTLFLGLLLAGFGFLLAAGIMRGFGAVLVATGAVGWAFHLTDGDNIFEAGSAHVGFGLMLSLGWVALGLMLWATSEGAASSHLG